MLYSGFDIYEIIAVFIAVLFAITLHEYAHARVAAWNGDYTAKSYGRLTLNPIKHFDPIGFLMLMAVGFGFAKPVPVNPNNYRKYRRGVFTVAIAGITTNLLIAFLCVPLRELMFGLIITGATPNEFLLRLMEMVYLIFGYSVLINISLAVFNLLPLYPLDGFRVLESFTRYNNPVTKFLRMYGQYILLALVGVSFIIDILNMKTVSPIFEYVDLLGYIIHTVGGFIGRQFTSFWSLFF